ncbi:gamma-glutamylcyclotransferase [Amphritea sp. 2_MG-2023]|uniref:gamma-glutamylcyclotransferase n=1 Tax=Amphritea TaxID=515417 RepID=UPI001C07CB05|nr:MULTISPECIES: gamma-glutamylcyclotransferase [Amphritea]MBU2967338.1 gamma-glutamylcyclotransferase [Amphritea atlantica]MDO6418408.1 gamma-glutamylcyclotransferase [Amphritea sp. 2_MG-2023]
MMSVVGYGSLLSERSALQTVPALQNFRLVRVPGYRRIFNKVGVVFISRFGADPASLQLASCSTQAVKTGEIICSQFECSVDDFTALYEREHRFRWVEVKTSRLDGLINPAEPRVGRMCTAYNDLDYRLNKCITPQEYERRVGAFYHGPLWRDDILPFPRYLAFCLQAVASQGQAVLDNFLDSSFLADGTTSIRTYLQQSEELQDWRNVNTGYNYRTGNE